MLPKALLGRKDIIGAAETGSGKTLAYGLPLLSDLLNLRDSAMDDDDDDDSAKHPGDCNAKSNDSASGRSSSPEGARGEVVASAHERVQGVNAAPPSDGLQALIICPTRELALQVTKHLKEVVLGTGLQVVVREISGTVRCFAQIATRTASVMYWLMSPLIGMMAVSSTPI